MKNSCYIISSRKYRPDYFEDVIGQDYITTCLKNSIIQNRIAQVLIFCGPHGVGKTTCARIFAKKINNYTKEDGFYNIFEIDAASNNSVEDIRNLRDQIRFPPQKGRYKVYIIDEVHMLSKMAFNSFLKTLEEPPSHAIFILATTEKNKIIPTILSRGQVYDFRIISIEDIYNYLKKISKYEGIYAEDEALYLIASQSNGSLRDALSIFDRLVSYSNKKLTADSARYQLGVIHRKYFFILTNYIICNNIHMVIITFDEIMKKYGYDPKYFIVGLYTHFRDLLISKNEKSIHMMETTTDIKDIYSQYTKKIDTNFLLMAMDICNKTELTYKISEHYRFTIEIALIQIASIINR